MTLNFKYKKVKRPNDKEIKSPSIPIVLQGKGSKYSFVALIDSGADVSVIPKDVPVCRSFSVSIVIATDV